MASGRCVAKRRRPHAVALLLAAVLLPACGGLRIRDDSPPTDAELVRPGAQRACENFADGHPQARDDPDRDGPAMSRLEEAHYGASVITESDGAYAELRDRLAALIAAVRAGDVPAVDREAAHVERICGPILRGDFPEPKPGEGAQE